MNSDFLSKIRGSKKTATTLRQAKITMEQITMFTGKTHHKWSFSGAMLLYQRVFYVCFLTWDIGQPPSYPEDALVKLLEVLSRRSQSLEVQDLLLGGDQLPRYHPMIIPSFTIVKTHCEPISNGYLTVLLVITMRNLHIHDLGKLQ